MREARTIPVEVEFTEGYQERFTNAILKIYGNRLQRAAEESDNEQNEVNVS